MVSDEIQAEWNSIGNTFDLLMGAKQGKLPVPMETEVGFNGDEAHGRGSLRHICEQVEDEGYTVETEYLGETTSAVSGDERHEFRVQVSDE